MKKKILFVLSLTTVFVTNLMAQNQFNERGNLNPQQTNKESLNGLIEEKTFSITSDRSYYYGDNHNRTTHELNTQLGTTGYANGGFDSIGGVVYTYSVREKLNGTTPYWQAATQIIPLRSQATLTEYRFLGKSLKSSGGTSSVTCKVYKKDFTTLLSSQTMTISTTLGYKSFIFANPATDNDTIVVMIQMNSVADSFKIAQSHNIWNGYNFGATGVFNTNVPFERLGSSLAVAPNNTQIYGTAWDDFDFLVWPKFSYSVTQSFTSSDNDLSICLGDSISFTNSNTGHLTNPIINWYDWYSKIDNNPSWYTTYIFDAGTPNADTAYSSDQSGGIIFNTAGLHTVKAVLQFGTWVVTPYDRSDTATFVVNVHALPSAPVITPNGSLGLCPGISVGLSSATASSYNWSTGATTQAITTSTPGTYTVSITDANGCVSPNGSVTVTANPTQNASFSYTSYTLCVSGDAVSPSLVDQTLTGTFSSTPGLSINSSGLITPSTSTPGQYTVTYTTISTQTSCTDTKTKTINITNSPVASFNYSAASYCNSASNQAVSFTGGGTAGSFASTSGLSINTSNGLIDVAQSTPGNYVVTNTINVSGCALTTANANVEIKATPTVTVTAPAICSGATAIVTAIPGVAGTYTYTWSVPSGTAPATTVSTFNPTAAGQYSVVITNPTTGCASQSANAILTINALPTVSISAPTVCAGSTATVTANPGIAGTYTYSWSNQATTQAISVTVAGNYSVTITDGNGCSVSAPTAVMFNSLPAVPTITPNGPTTFCQGGNVVLTSTSSNGYSWSSQASTQAITVTASGNYSVTITDGNGCSSVSAPTAVTVNSLPAVPTVTPNGPTTFCQGGNVILSSSTANGYSWSTQATSQTITVTASGNYTVTITDGNGCSKVSAPTTVTVNSCAGIEENTNNTFVVYPNPANDLINVTFSSVSENGTVELFTADGKVIESKEISDSMTETFNVVNLNSGVYYIVITSDNGRVSQKVIIE